ncbi:lytic transglycosylase domain-containing protein [Sphingomonas crusticola]|uniref:lytic transglycosylase domain-containing protein n=1 Tax=Sphingomonas crusticola TaxID=1697973 RepID=UPI0013C338B2|nr:lytic transglycosylase domain-containing protein [Sphingomonas crusticola]
MIHKLALSALALALAAPAAADVPAMLSAPVQADTLRQLNDADRLAYRQYFQLLRDRNFAAAGTLLDAQPSGPLTAVARADLFIANPSGRDPAAVLALLGAAPELPQAPVLARAAGAQVALPVQRALIRPAGPSKRAPTRPSRDCAALAARVQPLLRAGDPVSAEPIVEAAAATLTPEAVTEWRQKVAWAYFQSGDAASARRIAALAQAGAGDWAVDAAWVNGLASWRTGDYPAAADAFQRVASNASDDETRAAGLFWSARSSKAAGDAATAELRLRSASRLSESFYGMLANASLGLPLSPAGLAEAGDTNRLLGHSNLRAAAALVEIGETALADQLIRYQARIGAPAEHAALIAFAAKLRLPATQIWLTQNAPTGTRTSFAARFPMPAWSPAQGWRVDPALIYAHALQESEFRTDAVSSAGARGLMQLMPATASLIARHKGDSVGSLNDPSVSFEYGQSYLEELASAGGTGGLLPKVIAAYNAGPNNVARWTAGGDDPLLFIESIPFLQTRAYVAIVLRNYWIYQRETGAATPSLTAMAQGRWPLFPTRMVQTASAAAATHAPN